MSSALIVHVVPSETLGIARLHVHDKRTGRARIIETRKGLFVSGTERQRVLAKHPDAFWMLPVPPSAVWRPPGVRDGEIFVRSLERFLNAKLGGWHSVLRGASAHVLLVQSIAKRTRAKPPRAIPRNPPSKPNASKRPRKQTKPAKR